MSSERSDSWTGDSGKASRVKIKGPWYYIRATYDDALADRLDKAGLVDAAMAQLQDAIASYNQTNVTVGLARSAAHLFNGALDAHARSNATLRALDPGLMPQAGVPETAPLQSVEVAFVDRSTGDVTIWRQSSVAAFVRSLFGLNPPAAPAPAEPAREYHGNVFGLKPARA